ncbi:MULTISPECIES: ROK family transcriptional regulator [Leptolyngbya]|jgi:predicted NBD/HSP70 family sugar kinase|uniref:ROK family protein n=1 Tax=Leptolyngbya boryana NIES-2135 TaxID=1973484 RepID=A0A1Z4JGC8_LEPBY|nr:MULTISPECIES: ROK family transcriptional regulator [Leptolyngbya]BAY55713.1 ROK family protein [Leptolyngbya boryana NIES-2135]MBD2370393.1 ROK family transcriptional regulator [Leptolyngbya sp. FACHB-161]MBD2376737.1 ROK family transcriptional regulator [Leptolyngbya sp. FACHB-238]MBD2401008.1 ROK family transcriptional regulator [Leptolyngbya sp. FACHB-239]MBD2407655.1 ROK family transcriptional regulator [Leptolyngbya sp. FACHB-402]
MKANLSKKPLATDASLLKQINFTRILSLLRYLPHLTRAQIAHRTGLTRSTVTLITAELIEAGLVREGKSTASGTEGGRPGIELELNPEGAFFIGVAIEDEILRVVELNFAAQVTRRVEIPITDTAPDIIAQQLIELIQQVWEANPESKARSRGIGITIPGSLDRQGIVLRAPRLGWKNIDLRTYLDLYLDVPLYIENDANAGALAEMYLSGSMPSHSLLYLFLNVGIGAGMVLNNRLVRGAGGTASEVSELMIDPHDSDTPADVRPGTFEALCSKRGLLHAYYRRTGEIINLETLLCCLEGGDAIAQAVVNEWGKYLSWGVRGLVGVLNPEQIVFGGQLAGLIPYVRDQFDEMLQGCLPDGSGYGFDQAARFRLKISRFGKDSTAIGGAVLVYQSLFQMPDLLLLHHIV